MAQYIYLFKLMQPAIKSIYEKKEVMNTKVQHDVISVLLFGTENDQPDIPREENVVRLTERHFLEQIPPTANKRKAQKRCRVCYKKDIRKETCYYCPSCPSQPGLCYYPCFELYHTKFVYWANT